MVVLRLVLNEFLSILCKKFTMYTWSSVMKRNFSRHLEIITKKTRINLLSSRIVDESICFKNDHFLPKKPNKLFFHKNLLDFFVRFLGTMFQNTLLIDDMLHKSLFNLC